MRDADLRAPELLMAGAGLSQPRPVPGRSEAALISIHSSQPPGLGARLEGQPGAPAGLRVGQSCSPRPRPASPDAPRIISAPEWVTQTAKTGGPPVHPRPESQPFRGCAGSCLDRPQECLPRKRPPQGAGWSARSPRPESTELTTGAPLALHSRRRVSRCCCPRTPRGPSAGTTGRRSPAPQPRGLRQSGGRSYTQEAGRWGQRRPRNSHLEPVQGEASPALPSTRRKQRTAVSAPGGPGSVQTGACSLGPSRSGHSAG